MSKPPRGTITQARHLADTGGKTPTRRARKPAPAVVAAPVPVADPWADVRAKVADHINELTTADCMRLFTGRVHPNALVLDIEACPEVAEFKTKFGSDVMFSMGARLTEGGTSTTVGMVVAVMGVVRDGYVGILAMHQVNWDKGERHRLPLLMPIAELEARFQQNPFSVSVSLEGLGKVQLDRTTLTMQDILDGFMLAHRGLTPNEIDRRYTPAAATNIKNMLSVVSAYVPQEEGRNPEWAGWNDVPVDRKRIRHRRLWRTAKDTREQHAKGRYGTGERLIEEESYRDLKVVKNPETQETVALLRDALGAINLPAAAEQRILAAIETLTVKRGKEYANKND